jgi:hypothetical protein
MRRHKFPKPGARCTPRGTNQPRCEWHDLHEATEVCGARLAVIRWPPLVSRCCCGEPRRAVHNLRLWLSRRFAEVCGAQPTAVWAGAGGAGRDLRNGSEQRRRIRKNRNNKFRCTSLLASTCDSMEIMIMKDWVRAPPGNLLWNASDRFGTRKNKSASHQVGTNTFGTPAWARNGTEAPSPSVA